MLEYDEIDIEEFEKEFGKFIESKGLVAKKLYNYYYNDVYPYLDLISSYRGRDEPVTKEIIQNVLGIGGQYMRVMEDVFPELKQAMEAKQGYMDLVAQKALIKANLLKPENSKPIEMMLERWDKGYKPKDGNEVELPSQLNITIKNEKKEDKELEPYAPDVND